jgi:hypothetical protein
MFFARAYYRRYCDVSHGRSIERQIEEDMVRNYSWWAGSYSPGFGLSREPGYPSPGEYAKTLPENAEDLHEDHEFVGRGGWRLPGLCAVCAATSYQELARKVRKDSRDPDGWIGGRKPDIAILEGELVGTDPDGWSVFKARKLLAIAKVDAIASAPDAPSGKKLELGPC